MVEIRPFLAPAAALAALLPVLGMAGSARAHGCALEVSGGNAEWIAASESLRELALDPDDCARLRIDIREHGARVLFTTADGRSAEREVSAPHELRATVEALRVRGPDAAGGAIEPAPPAAEANVTTAQRVEPSRRGRGAATRVTLLAGARGGPDSLVSPLLMAELALGWRWFELGASLGVEAYPELGGARNVEREGSGAAVGAHVGLREVLGPFDVRAGGRAALVLFVSSTHEIHTCPRAETCSSPGEDERSGELRLGAYAGFALPRRSAVRVRAELGADVALPPAADGTLALTPGWALSALIGMELAP